MLAGGLAAPLPAMAQASAQELQITAAEGQSRRVELGIGKSVIVDLPRDAKEVFVANPKVANAIVRSTRKIFVIGQADGQTNVVVMDADGRQIANLDINIGRDLNLLRRTLRAAVPSGTVNVVPVGDTIVLTGVVASAGDAAAGHGHRQGLRLAPAPSAAWPSPARWSTRSRSAARTR